MQSLKFYNHGARWLLLVLNVKVLVAAVNQDKALVLALFRDCETSRRFVCSSILHTIHLTFPAQIGRNVAVVKLHSAIKSMLGSCSGKEPQVQGYQRAVRPLCQGLADVWREKGREEENPNL